MVSSGVDSNKKVIPILVDSDGRPYVVLTDGTNNLGTTHDYGTDKTSLAVSIEAGKNTFSEEYTTAQTATVIINPDSDKKVSVVGVSVGGDGAAGVVSLDFVTSGKKVFRHYMSKTSHTLSSTLHIVGAANENLSLTTTTGTDTIFVTVNYRLVA